MKRLRVEKEKKEMKEKRDNDGREKGSGVLSSDTIKVIIFP